MADRTLMHTLESIMDVDDAIDRAKVRFNATPTWRRASRLAKLYQERAILEGIKHVYVAPHNHFITYILAAQEWASLAQYMRESRGL